MKVAAYQTPLLPSGSMQAIELIRDQVDWCESAGVEILCCPEGVLGGLADYAAEPGAFAIDVEGGQLSRTLAPLASRTVTTVLGFTEIDARGVFYNSAAVFHQGSVTGLYRKLYPAINKSIYAPGDKMPVFRVGELTFGIVICLDSNYFEPARIMASRGAAALFIPTNNGLPPAKAHPKLVAQARNTDIARAIENRISVIRADVAGSAPGLMSYGSSAIIDPDGMVLQSAEHLGTTLLVADIETKPRMRRREWNAASNPAVADEYARMVGIIAPDVEPKNAGQNDHGNEPRPAQEEHGYRLFNANRSTN